MAVAPALAVAAKANPWGQALQIGGGVVGLFGSKQDGQRADGYRSAAAKLLGLRGVGTEAALGSALSYDPAREDKAAADYASEVAGNTFANTWQSMGSKFRKMGGDAGGDTRFATQMAGAAGSIFDPMKGWLANQASTRTMRKIGALTTAVNSGNDVTGQYMGMAEDADRQAGSMGDALGLIAGGIDGGKKPGSKTPTAAAPVDPFSKWKPRAGR